jgi:uncharacterized protein (DUF1330 family)
MDMAAFAIFDVEIRDATRYQEFMSRVKPALEQAGAKYLARGGQHRVYEGDWEPRRIVLLEFPSLEAFEAFYNGVVYQGLKSIRDECSSARLVGVSGIE